MRATHDFLVPFLESKRDSFIIPVYQRNYDWKQKNCEKLFNDVVNIYESNLESYFIGSIVTYPNPRQDRDSRLSEKLIIDGQQRITTLFILLLALRDSIVESDIDEPEVIESVESIIFNLKSKKLKLKSVKQDDDALYSLIAKTNKEKYLRSNIYFNYSYFKRAITENKISPFQLLKSLDKLQIVNITLEEGRDNPQLIFESLNSTGVDLSGADLIRNFLLMDLPADLQENFFFNYWQNIEEKTKFRVKELIRHYLTIKTKTIPKKNDKEIYESFKVFFRRENMSKEDFLIEMLDYSKYYNWIAYSTYPDKKISKVLTVLNQLEVGVAYPYLLDVFSKLDNEDLSENEVLRTLETIRGFVFRRIICGAPTNALNKIFMNLPFEIDRVRFEELDYVQKLQLVLVQKKSSQRYPDDFEFKDNLINKEIYRMKSKNKVYLLEKLEEYKNPERNNVRELLSNREVSIEHIMPQKLNDSWKEYLGKDYQDIHEKYLHRLGNLSLSAFNTPMGNKSFAEKKALGFDDSRFYLNKYLGKIDEWNSLMIEKRGEKLANRALKIWKYPVIDESYLNIEEDSYFELGDYEYFSGRKVKRIEFSGQSFIVKGGHWMNMYKIICEKLFELDPQLFIMQEENPVFLKYKRKYISTSKKELTKPLEVGDGVFIEGNLNTYYYCTNLIELFSIYEWDESDLQIYLK